MALYMKFETTAVMILAGGRSTRLGDICKNTPKSMLKVGDYPFLSYLAAGYIRVGLKPIIILAGHLGAKITKYFSQSVWKNSSVFVRHLKNDDGNYGTGARVIRDAKTVNAENILVVNGDTVLDFSIPDLLQHHQLNNSDCTIVLTRLSGVPNYGAFLVGAKNKVLFSREILSSERFRHPDLTKILWQGSSTGAILFRKDILQSMQISLGRSLEHQLLPSLIEKGKVTAFDNEERTFFDFGDPKTLSYLQTRIEDIFRIYGSPEIIAKE